MKESLKRIYLAPTLEFGNIDPEDIITTSMLKGIGDESDDVFVDGSDLFW